MQALGVAPNAETYELLLDAQGAAGNVEAMRRSLAAAVAAGLRLSPAGWSGVMGHFGACGDLEVGVVSVCHGQMAAVVHKQRVGHAEALRWLSGEALSALADGVCGAGRR